MAASWFDQSFTKRKLARSLSLKIIQNIKKIFTHKLVTNLVDCF